MEQENNMNYKELFVLTELDYGDYVAVIADLETHQFHEAVFSCQQRGGGFGNPSIVHKEAAISHEQVKALAEKSKDSRVKKYLEITNENWKDLIHEI